MVELVEAEAVVAKAEALTCKVNNIDKQLLNINMVDYKWP